MDRRPDDDYDLTGPGAAELLGKSIWWVQRATREGHLPHQRLTPGGHPRYSSAELRAWMESKRVQPRSVSA